MKQVEFVQVKSKIDGYGLGKGIACVFEGVEDIIRYRIEDNWEYKGYIPIVTRGAGGIETLSLIFQKEI